MCTPHTWINNHLIPVTSISNKDEFDGRLRIRLPMMIPQDRLAVYADLMPLDGPKKINIIMKSGLNYMAIDSEVIGWELSAYPGEKVELTTILDENDCLWHEWEGDSKTLPQLIGKMGRIAQWDHIISSPDAKEIKIGVRFIKKQGQYEVRTYYSVERGFLNPGFLQGSPFHNVL